MTYDAEKVKMGREAVVVAEIRLDKCRNVYGSSPCTAAVGVTGAQKCFNTCRTCQDIAHYNPVPKSQMFSNRPCRSMVTSLPRGRVFVAGAGTIFTAAPAGAALGAHAYIEFLEDGGDLWAMDGNTEIRLRGRVITNYVIT